MKRTSFDASRSPVGTIATEVLAWRVSWMRWIARATAEALRRHPTSTVDPAASAVTASAGATESGDHSAASASATVEPAATASVTAVEKESTSTITTTSASARRSSPASPQSRRTW